MRFTLLNRTFVKDPSFRAYHLDKILVKTEKRPLLTIDVRINSQQTKVPTVDADGVEKEDEYDIVTR